MSSTNQTNAAPLPPAKVSELSKIKNFFQHVDVEVKDWFVDDFGPAAHTFAVGCEALLKTQLGQLAQVAVQNAEALETGQEKAAAAGAALLAAAEQAGLQLSESAKNLLIEVAVQALKGTFGIANSPAATD